MRHVLKADFDRVICDEFLGMNGVYHGFGYMKEYELRGGTPEDIDNEIMYAKKANLKIARTFFGVNVNCHAIEGPYDMHSERMEAYCRWFKKLQDNGIDVAIECGNGATYYGHEKPDGERDPYIFAEWAYRTMDYLINERGFTNIKYLSLFVEPTTHERKVIPEGYPDTWSYYVPVVRAIDERFKRGGLRDKMKLVGPNNSQRGRHLANAVADLGDVIDIFSGHFYNYTQHWEWKEMCDDFSRIVKPTGKPFWMDEYGIQLELLRNTPQYGTKIASIVAASVAAGHQTSLIWTLFDQLHLSGAACELPEEYEIRHHYNIDSFFDTVHRWGLRHWAHDTYEAGEAYPAWYAYCLLANALGGDNVKSCFSEDMCNDYFSAEKNAATCYLCAVKSGADITMVAVNSNASPCDILLDTNGGDRSIYRYSFEPWSSDEFYETAKEPIKLKMINGKIEDTLPKGGFCVYSTRADIPTDYN